MLSFCLSNTHTHTHTHTCTLKESGTLICSSQRNRQIKMSREKDRGGVEEREMVFRSSYPQPLVSLIHIAFISSHRTDIRLCVCVCVCLRVHVDLNILDRLTWCNFLILYLWLSLHNLSVETSLFSSLSFNLCQYSSLLNSHLFSSVFPQLFYVSFMNLFSAITLMTLINKCLIKAVFARHYHLPPH